MPLPNRGGVGLIGAGEHGIHRSDPYESSLPIPIEDGADGARVHKALTSSETVQKEEAIILGHRCLAPGRSRPHTAGQDFESAGNDVAQPHGWDNDCIEYSRIMGTTALIRISPFALTRGQAKETRRRSGCPRCRITTKGCHSTLP